MENFIKYGSFRLIAEHISWILLNINLVVVNWGFSVILLTIIIKVALLPLSYMSYNSLLKLQKKQPELNSVIKKQTKNIAIKDLTKLYTKQSTNPIKCCLPILIQTPIFISLYCTLNKSIEFKRAPFVLWITDLSLMDPYFLLPIIMGLSIFFQQKINNKVNKVNNINKILPVFVTLFFLWFPSFLLIYWITNNLINAIQHSLIKKYYEEQ
ncbi:YidC/Oxa1 family membrane protein insertase [Candidatus Portiera aleyrodidarum]|uniref:Membrane insertase YidC/Oxa/ALB C-terminal domain-containing protein n=1 Tax=Candidatus Portiera aleyrodidarum MED (Bemisia tabaci) TaxID=1163752 RepID=A0AAU8RPS0_9GAMM|nr:membrane protein insertase YidC [Candidatus Portiera aleyrodidarum]AFS18762.1 Membrane protein insertase YidC [Candidatus Portiera aleyrodidarum BT-QVLC]AJF23976.1 hypothetical protein O3E_00145 [Candidatus Portiera aleyrodidarum MED (Bemisia tabaci)]